MRWWLEKLKSYFGDIFSVSIIIIYLVFGIFSNKMWVMKMELLYRIIMIFIIFLISIKLVFENKYIYMFFLYIYIILISNI